MRMVKTCSLTVGMPDLSAPGQNILVLTNEEAALLTLCQAPNPERHAQIVCALEVLIETLDSANEVGRGASGTFLTAQNVTIVCSPLRYSSRAFFMSCRLGPCLWEAPHPRHARHSQGSKVLDDCISHAQKPYT
jgi:hypothetical protein